MSTSEVQDNLRQAFLDDARENLSQAEDLLLALTSGDRAPDTIAALFRAIHSVKGSAGSFGFGLVTETAHGLETCLDELRSNKRGVTPKLIEVQLRGVDLLKRLVETPDVTLDAERAELKRLLAGIDEPEGEQPPWLLTFTPGPDILTTGPDPVKLLSALQALGEVSLQADASAVPRLETLDPLHCAITWKATIAGSVTKARIEEVFDWVDGGWSVERAAPPAAKTVDAPTARAAASTEQSSTIRVPVDKLDQLMNMVGELVITQSMLGELDASTQLTPARLAQIGEGLAQLARNTRSLQESVMRLRSQPLSVVFARLPRTVHDLAQQLGKKVELVVSGDATELDKTVLEKLGDPLVHLVRNCVDHGLETPDKRIAAGKRETGTLKIASYGRGKDIYIEVEDDGAGLDEAKILAKAKDAGLVAADAELSSAAIAQLIFSAGLSTAAVVSDVSGRGVGMDVVRQNVRALGGEITIRSTPGKGTCFTLRLPLSLAIMEGQLVRIDRRLYVVPLLAIVESIQPDWANLQACGHEKGYRMRGELIPVVDLPTSLGVPQGDRSSCLMVVVETDRGRVGLLVDELLNQQQVVVKSLEVNYGAVPGLAGATILGDGSVSLILEPNDLYHSASLSN